MTFDGIFGAIAMIMYVGAALAESVKKRGVTKTILVIPLNIALLICYIFIFIGVFAATVFEAKYITSFVINERSEWYPILAVIAWLVFTPLTLILIFSFYDSMKSFFYKTFFQSREG